MSTRQSRRRARFLLPAAGIALSLTVWSAATSPSRPLLPPPTAVLRELYQLALSGALLRDATVSLGRVLAGVAIAAAIATFLGIVTALWRDFGRVVGGPVELLRPIPPIAWTPLAIMVAGVGNAPAVAIVAIGAFFPLWLGISQSVEEIRTEHLMAAQSLGAGRSLLVRAIMVPSMLPYVLHGLRLAVGIGWFCLVAAEMTGASSGLGYRLQVLSLNLQIAAFDAYLVVIGVLGFSLNTLIAALARRFSGWKVAQT